MDDDQESDKPIVLIEDGHTFLSREELDAYREQQVRQSTGPGF